MILNTISVEYVVGAIAVLISTIISIIYYHKKNKSISFQHDSITTKIVSDRLSCSESLKELMSFHPRILGLDCEWVGKNKVSLLQLAHENMIVLIRMHKLKTIPIELIGLLSNNKIIKCGVGIYGDAAKLRYDYNIDTFGCVDMNDIFDLIPNNNNLLIDSFGYLPSQNELKGITFGLNKFSQILLKESMKYKNKKITRSNWEKYELTKEQCHYAADDALIGYKLFKKAMELSSINDDYLDFCYGRIDTHHYNKKHNDDNYVKKVKINSSIRKNSKQNKKDSNGLVRNQGKSKAFFDNCKILKPNGEILSCCSTKGMRWYIKKGLAEVIDEKTVKLTFEPKIRGLSFDKYHQSIKKSQCFVCGKEDNLCKFAVVPECYRQFIDEKYNNKAWRIHDHIPLCIYCHQQAMRSQDMVRDKLCDQYNVPHYLVQKKNEDYQRLFKAKKAAWALTKKNTIPKRRKVALLQHICEFYGLEYNVIYSKDNEEENKQSIDNEYEGLIEIKSDERTTTDILKKYINKLNETPTESIDRKQWKIHSQTLVELFKDNHIGFIEMWRKAFVDNMKPRFLPDIWSVSNGNM